MKDHPLMTVLNNMLDDSIADYVENNGQWI